MFATSADVLNLILTACLVTLTVFLCFALYYFAASMQKIHQLSKKIEQGVTKAEELVETAHAKLRNSTAYFMIVGELAKKAMEFLQERRNMKKATSKKK